MIYIIFDRPQNNNDKQWLFDTLKEKTNFDVSAFYTPSFLLQLKIPAVSKILCVLVAVYMSIKCIVVSHKNDTILCWSSMPGLLLNFISRLCGNNRRLILFNWLSPSPRLKSIHVYLCRKAVDNPQCILSFNSYHLPEEWKKRLNVNKLHYVIIPDVYNSNDEIILPCEKKDKYCFAGGYAYRNWKYLLNLAESLQEIKFVCCVSKRDFQNQIKNVPIPPNVRVLYDVVEKEYYLWMRNSSLVLLPLKINKVAGLINIIKSAQYGIRCLFSYTKATEMYAPQDLNCFLPDDKVAACDMIQGILNQPEETYKAQTQEFQKHILSNFSPESVVEKLICVI